MSQSPNALLDPTLRPEQVALPSRSPGVALDEQTPDLSPRDPVENTPPITSLPPKYGMSFYAVGTLDRHETALRSKYGDEAYEEALKTAHALADEASQLSTKQGPSSRFAAEPPSLSPSYEAILRGATEMDAEGPEGYHKDNAQLLLTHVLNKGGLQGPPLDISKIKRAVPAKPIDAPEAARAEAPKAPRAAANINPQALAKLEEGRGDFAKMSAVSRAVGGQMTGLRATFGARRVRAAVNELDAVILGEKTIDQVSPRARQIMREGVRRSAITDPEARALWTTGDVLAMPHRQHKGGRRHAAPSTGNVVAEAVRTVASRVAAATKVGRLALR